MAISLRVFRLMRLLIFFEHKKRPETGRFVHGWYSNMHFETCQLFLKYLKETIKEKFSQILAAEKCGNMAVKSTSGQMWAESTSCSISNQMKKENRLSEQEYPKACLFRLDK